MSTKVKPDRRTLSSSLSQDVLLWLLNLGYSQVEVARVLGVGESFISLVKSRERSLTLDHMNALASTLNIPLGALLLRITEREPATPQDAEFAAMIGKLMQKTDDAVALMRAKLADPSK